MRTLGVFSAGNAPAMRSALLGLLYGDDDEKLKEFVKVNTEITHTDSKAYYGALAVAKASYLASIYREDEFFDDKEFRELLESVKSNLELSSLEFADSLGDGVGGYYLSYSAPIVLHSWLRNRDDLKQSIINVVLCGGDTILQGLLWDL